MEEKPAADRLEALQEQYSALLGDEDSLRTQLVTAQANSAATQDRVAELESTLAASDRELADLKRLSANALNLDITNRRLTEESQVMRSRLEILEAENLRLKESEDSRAFFNGALAVLAGVLIALIAQRLRPRPRSSTSWV
jgi:SH3 domain protein